MLTKQFIGGFVCGEGSFSQWSIARKEKSYKVFRFCITQHQREMSLLEEMRDTLGYGTVRRKSSPKNNPIFVEYMICRTPDLVKFFNDISPFLIGFKKEQATKWFQELMEYKNNKNNKIKE